jgi:hypothetical protein
MQTYDAAAAVVRVVMRLRLHPPPFLPFRHPACLPLSRQRVWRYLSCLVLHPA